MIVMLYAWYDGVMGMDITLICYGICVLFYLSVCFLIHANRKGAGKVLLGWMLCEAICDGAWWFCFYPNGVYVNPGIGGMTACLLLPFLLFIAAFAVTALNIAHIEER